MSKEKNVENILKKLLDFKEQLSDIVINQAELDYSNILERNFFGIEHLAVFSFYHQEKDINTEFCQSYYYSDNEIFEIKDYLKNEISFKNSIEEYEIKLKSNNYLLITYYEKYLKRYFCFVIKQNKEKDEFQKWLNTFEDVTSKTTDYGILISDYNGNILFANDKIKKISGFPKDEIIGQKVYDLEDEFFQNDINKWRAEFEKLKNTDSYFVLGSFKTKSGKRIRTYVNPKYVPQLKNDGLIVSFIRSAEEEKFYQNKIENQKYFYENILDNLPADLVVFTPDAEYIYLNKHAVSNKERRKWLIGKKDNDFLHLRPDLEDVFKQRKQNFDKALLSKSNISFQETFLVGENKQKVIIRNLKPILDENQEIKNVIGYGLDITELTETQKRLEVSERLHKAVNSATYKLAFSDSLEEGIYGALKELCVDSYIDRITILSKNKNSDKFEAAIGYCVSENLNEINLTNLKLIQHFLNKVAKEKTKEENFYLSKNQSEYLQALNVSKAIFIPVFIDNNFWGIFQIDFIDEDNILSEFKNLEEISLFYFTNFLAVYVKNKELSQLNKRISDIYRYTSDFVALYDANTQELNLNNSALKRFGYTEDEAKKLDLRSFYDEIEHHKLTNIVFPKLQRKGKWEGSLRFITKNGEKFKSAVSVLKHENNEGRISHFSIIARDLSEIDKLNNELASANELIENIFNASPNYLMAFEPIFNEFTHDIIDFRFISFNNNTKQFFGLDEDSLLLSKYNIDKEGYAFFEVLKRVLETKEKVNYEQKNLFTKSGLWHRVVVIPLKYGVSVTISDITERKLSEIQRHKDKQELHRAQKIANLANWRMDLKTKEIKFSEQFKTIFGKDESEESITLNEIKSIIDLQDFKLFNKICEENFKNGKKTIFIHKVYLNDEIRYVEVIAEKINNEETASNEVFGTVQDITEQKSREFELFKIKHALENSKEEVYLFDLDSMQFDFVNQAALKNLGYQNNEIKGKTPKLFYKNFDFEYFKQEITPLLTKEKNALELKAKFIRKDTSSYPALVKVNLFEFQSKFWCLALVEDVTEKVKVEQKIKENEKTLKEAQALANFGSWQYHKFNNELTWTEQVYIQFGVKRNKEKITFYNDYILNIDPDEREKVLIHINDTISNNKINSFRHKIIDVYTGKYSKTLDVIIKPSFFENDQPRGVIGTFIDVTQKVKAEEQLKRAKILAEQSVRAKENFLANMSHEIRTPLNGIIGVLSLLRKTELNYDQQELVEIIDSSSENLLAIINDILDLTKIDAGKINFENVTIDIANTLILSTKIFEIKASEKNIKFHQNYQLPKHKLVFGDHLRINQIINNLLSNAIKFTPKGGNVTFFVELVKETKNTIIMNLVVKDSGIGIADEQKASIFEDFVQASSDITRRFGGSGLGLSITKRLVNLMNGTIEVESEQGKGTTFIITIPFIKSYDKLKVSEEINVNMTNNFLLNKRILLAEDNMINRFLAVKLISSWESTLKIDEAENGQIAKEKFEQNDYDIILLDIQMPILSGVDLIKHIRKHPNDKKRNIPVIALTANVMENDAKEYLSLGMSDFLGKPFKEEHLQIKLKKWLSNQEVSDSDIIIDNVEESPLETEDVKQLYNFDEVRKIANNNEVFVKNMAKLFIDLGNETITGLEKAIESKEYEKISKVAHKIKSSLNTLKSFDLKEKALEIEKFEIDNDKIDKLLNKIENFKTELKVCMETVAKEFDI